MRTKRMTAAAVIFVLLGTVIGLLIATGFERTESGRAANIHTSAVPIGAEREPLAMSTDVDAWSNHFADVAESVIPSVVAILSTKKVRAQNPFGGLFDEDFLRRFFGYELPPREFLERGLGSGVIVNNDGYILTNNHVVKGADQLEVVLGKKNVPAKLIGTDPESDLAVVKIKPQEGMKAAILGDSDKLRVGQWVLAIGSPFSLNLQHTVTAGIVSAKNRTSPGLGQVQYQDFIQTDAAINPGNSGGALVNLHGEVVGINSAIISPQQSGGFVGIGFAIPINMAKQVMPSLIEHGRVIRGWLGVYISSLTETDAKAWGLSEPKGALVQDVTKDGPADKAGIEAGDIILEFDGKQVEDSRDLMNMVAQRKPDTKVKVTVLRNGKRKTFAVTLGERPSSAEQPAVAERNEKRLGLTVQNLTDRLRQRFGYEGEEGVLVTDVDPSSVAYQEGIRPGDLIKAVNRRPVRSVTEFRRIIDKAEPGDVILFRLRRGDRNYFVAVKIPER